jgi:hypothetical protein
MKMRRITKKLLKAQARFKADIEGLLTRLGAEHHPGGWYDWTLKTPVGPLDLSVNDRHVHTRFVSHRGGFAATLGDSNPTSGKWNHYWPERELSTADNDMQRYLGEVLAYAPSKFKLQQVAEDLAEDEADKARWAVTFARWAAEGDARRASLAKIA